MWGVVKDKSLNVGCSEGKKSLIVGCGEGEITKRGM